MAIAPTLRTYLEEKHIEYDVIAHEPTMSSMSTAKACPVSGGSVVKGVVLRLRDGYLLAVLPASHRLRLADLKMRYGEDFDFATEHELAQLFPDCTLGAVPAVGECYGLDLVVEDSIREPAGVYFEGGDHTTVVHMSQGQFARLVGDAPRAHFGDPD